MGEYKNIPLGVLIGSVFGIIDITPMIIMNLPIEAILSAFSLWMISGFFVVTSKL